MNDTKTRSEQEALTEERIKRFEAARDSLGDLFDGVRDAQLRHMSYNILRAYTFVPKTPRELLQLMELVMDSTVFWLLADGIVTLNDEYRVTEAERAAREEKRAGDEEGPTRDDNVVPINGYL